MMSKECNKLFDKLWWHSDNELAIQEFVEAIKEWTEDWNKGNIKIALIDLNQLDSNFSKGHCYIAYDDCSGNNSTEIYETGKFIFYIQKLYNEYSDDLYPEEYWIDKLNGILNKYE